MLYSFNTSSNEERGIQHEVVGDEGERKLMERWIQRYNVYIHNIQQSVNVVGIHNT